MKRILFAVDNSSLSRSVAETTLMIAKVFGSQVIGVHGYNAVLHERAFRIMEPILPERYREKSFLTRQREFHDRLIKEVMERISLSYLEPFFPMFDRAGVDFRWVVREGKNFKVILDVAGEVGADLIVLGSYGFNGVRDGYLGSVCLRVLRGFGGKVLVVKGKPAMRKVVVGLDGSGYSLNLLKEIGVLADFFGSELHLLYVYDTNLHRFVFEKLKKFMYHTKGFSFRSEEQERIHDEFIDRGLKRVGEMVLERGKEVLEEIGFRGKVVCEAVEGFVYEGICDYARRVGADLVAVGKFGRHRTEGTDLGSVAENVVRFSPASVLVGGPEGSPEWEI